MKHIRSTQSSFAILISLIKELQKEKQFTNVILDRNFNTKEVYNIELLTGKCRVQEKCGIFKLHTNCDYYKYSLKK